MAGQTEEEEPSLAGPQDWRTPLRDDFEGPDFAPEGGLYYRRNFEQSAGTLEFQRDVRLSGKGALKLSVRPIVSADGEPHSERAEVWERTRLRVPYFEGVWYGFAVRFAEPVPMDGHRYLIAQWKREIVPGAAGDFSPFLAIRMRNGKLFATTETNHVPPPGGRDASVEAAVPVFVRAYKNQQRALIATDGDWTDADNHLFHDLSGAVRVTRHGDLPSPRSGWIRFAVFVKPGPLGDGRVEIIANGQPVVTVTGRIGHEGEGLGAHQYFKFGPYRQANNSVWTLYYDHFRRSPHFEDVI